MTHEFPPDWKDGVYAAIMQRRDIRSFRPDPIPSLTLARILNAAHHAGSVGYMQPWNFLVVEDRELRKKIQAHVEDERRRAAAAFDEERREKYLSFKLEGILDAAINICVTCDPTRHGPEVLGRHTIRDTDMYSTCCAIQNLWLAARAEGIGVGWVSILDPQFLREVLGIPGHILPVAYLCVGCVDAFPEKPMLETASWLPRLPLSDLVYRNQWGSASDPGFVADLQKASSSK